jgi:hypothetical protein
MGENPSRLCGHLENLPKIKVHKVAHHAALPYRDVGSVMAKCRRQTFYFGARTNIPDSDRDADRRDTLPEKYDWLKIPVVLIQDGTVPTRRTAVDRLYLLRSGADLANWCWENWQLHSATTRIRQHKFNVDRLSTSSLDVQACRRRPGNTRWCAFSHVMAATWSLYWATVTSLADPRALHGFVTEVLALHPNPPRDRRRSSHAGDCACWGGPPTQARRIVRQNRNIVGFQRVATRSAGPLLQGNPVSAYT